MGDEYSCLGFVAKKYDATVDPETRFGGPLICMTDEGAFELQGVASVDSMNIYQGNAPLFTNMYNNLAWIEEQMSEFIFNLWKILVHRRIVVIHSFLKKGAKDSSAILKTSDQLDPVIIFSGKWTVWTKCSTECKQQRNRICTQACFEIDN